MAYNSMYGLTRIAFLGYYGDATTPGQPTTQKSLWGYVTNDAAAAVETANYFTPAAVGSLLSVGDAIDAVMVVAGTPVRKSYVVLTASSAGVTIGVQTATAG